jgi:transcriptional regulator with XRE-family HTH domain
MAAPKTQKSKTAKAVEPLDAISTHLCRRLKQLRAERDWSLDALSKACGVSRSMISQIERNQTNPTLAVMFRIAQAFGMSLGQFVEAPGVTSAVSVIRAGDRAYHYRSDKDCQIRTLSPLHLEKDVEFYEVTLQPGGALRSSAHFEGTREFLTVQKGNVRVESAGDAEDLEPGDSASYRADVPHAIVNVGRSLVVIFLVDIYR